MMTKEYANAFQLKIILKDIESPIWRRIQVPEYYTLWDMQVAIQDAMDWYDSYMHHFEVNSLDKTGEHFDFVIPA